jgi:hypothetical protein
MRMCRKERFIRWRGMETGGRGGLCVLSIFALESIDAGGEENQNALRRRRG